MKFIDEDVFDEEQLKQIKKGKKKGLNKKEIRLYARVCFNSFQMKLIRKSLESGLSYKKVELIANPN